nr:hypothetical protein [Mycobacterium sp.]
RRLAQHPAKGKIGSSEWTDIFNEVTYSTAVWTSRADLFAKYARTGRGGPLVKAYRQTAMFGDDNMLAVYNAVQCTDAPWPAELAADVAAVRTEDFDLLRADERDIDDSLDLVAIAVHP